jgi:archaemetzincin
MKMPGRFLFILFITGMLLPGCNSVCKNTAAETIYIQPFYPFSNEHAQQIADSVHKFYHCKIVMLPAAPIYKDAKSASGRYSATKLLTLLGKQVSDKQTKILALTSEDIFCKKNGVKEWGIFGLGECPGDACVVSDFRLKKFKEKTEEFTINVVLHELGHTFGLPHSNYNEQCLMNDAKGTIKTLYKEKRMLCTECSRKIGLRVL